MHRSANIGSHLKVQYILLVGAVVMGMSLPKAYAVGGSDTARIAQLESKVVSLSNRIQALETKTTFLRRTGSNLEVNASNLILNNTALTLTGPRATLTVRDGDVTFGKDLLVEGNATVNGNTLLGNAVGDTLTVKATSNFQEDVMADKNVTATLDIVSTTGEITATLGDVTSVGGNVVSVGGDVISVGGDVTSVGGDVVAVTGDIMANDGSLFIAQSASIYDDLYVGDGGAGDEVLFNVPTLDSINLGRVTFNFTQGFRRFAIDDANVLVRNTGGPLATNGWGNIIIGDGLVGAQSTYGSAPASGVTNSFLMGYGHQFLNAHIRGGIFSGNGHSAGGDAVAMLGGYANITGGDYGFSLGGHNNFAQRGGTGQVGGFNNTFLGGNFDDWHVGVGNSEFDPN